MASAAWPYDRVAAVAGADNSSRGRAPTAAQAAPREARAQAKAPAKAKVDCSEITWAKQNLTADALRSLAAAHPAQAKAAKDCK